MKTTQFLKSALLTSLGTVLLSGCVYHERTVYSEPAYGPAVTQNEVVVATPPPAPIIEEQTFVAPGPGYIWISGAWVWHNNWTWEQGHWAQPPHHGAVWLPGHYAYRNGHHLYIRGRWQG
jgi:hypothetical protein